MSPRLPTAHAWMWLTFCGITAVASLGFTAEIPEPAPSGAAPSPTADLAVQESQQAPAAVGTPAVPTAPSNDAAVVAAPQPPKPEAAQHHVAVDTAPARAASTNGQPAPESNVVSLAGREGFRWKTQRGDFEFNPYTLVQSYAQANYVNSRWLALTDQDDTKGVGFGIGNAILGVAGRGFERVTFNLALNPVCAGGCLLNQAWLDLSVSDALRVRVGKFKVPAHWAVQVRLGQTLLPRLPSSLLARVNLPFGLNAVNPSMALGFDTGVMVHGIVARHLEYQLGVFNGEGISVNAPTSTLRDNRGIPGLLYAARIAYHPLALMKPEESASLDANSTQILIGLSSSYNVEANSESSDDLRAGLELALRTRGLYLSAEGYLLRMAFVERQRGEAARMFLGAYGQVGVDAGRGVEPVARIEVFDRNSLSELGALLLPAMGVNWYLAGQNLKLSALYQTLIRARYRSELEAHQDDNAIYDHSGLVQIQFAL